MHVLHYIHSLVTLGIGIYMIANNAFGTPPSLSGIAFIVIAISLFLVGTQHR